MLHLPWVSSWLVRTAIDRVEGPLGLDIETSGVSAWPMGLSATLRDVRIRAIADAEPFLSADSLTIDLPLAAIRNRSRIGHISLARPRIDVDGLTRWIDSRPPSKTPNPTVPRIDSLTLTDATLSSERLAFTIPGMTLTMASTMATPLGGAIAASNATLRVGNVVFDQLAIDGALRYDGAVVIERARLTSHETRLDVAGRIGMREGDRQMALTVGGTVAPLGRILEPYLAHPRIDGTVRLDGRVDGTFLSPRLTATLRSGDLTMDDDPAGDVTTRLVLSRQRLDIHDVAWERLLGGRATGRAAFDFNDALDSAIHVDVEGVATAPVLAMVDPAWPSIRSRATGAVRIEGPLAKGRRPHVTADMTLARADASPLASAGRVAVTLDPRRWTTSVRDLVIGQVALQGDLAGDRPADTEAPFATSTFTGQVTASAADPDDALALLHALDIVDMDFSEYTLGGALTGSATLSGTLRSRILEAVVDVPALTAHGGLTGTLHATATIDPRSIALHDGRAVLGDTTATMRGRVDLVARRLALDTTVDARSTDAVVRLFDLPRQLTPVGAFTATGQLTGSPDLPRIDAAVAGSDLVLAGQAPAAASGTIGWDGTTLTCRPCTLTRKASTFDVAGEWNTIDRRVAVRGTLADWRVDPVTWPAATTGDASTTYPVHGVASGTFDVLGVPDALSGSAHLALRDTQWSTTRPGTVDVTATLAHGEVDVTLAAPDLSVTGHAVIDQASPYAFEATADLAGADLATLVSRLALDARGTLGRVTGSLSASGQLANRDSVVGTVSLSAFDGTWRDLPLRLERPSSFAWSTRALTTHNVALSLADVRLDVDGELSSRGEARGVTAAMSGRAEQIARILAALEIAVPAMEGTVDARLAFTGSPDAPSIDGHFVIADGVVTWPDLPPVRGITADVRIGDGVATLTSARAQAQDATIDAHGRAPVRMFAPFLPGALAARLPASTSAVASLETTLTNLSHVTALAYLGERVPGLWRGGVDAAASLTATRLSPDAVDGTVRMTRATLASGDLSVEQTAPGLARIARGTLVLEPWHFLGSGTDITVSGSANLAEVTYPYAFSLDGTLDMRLLGTILPGRVNGALRSALRVEGSTKDLDVLGRVEVNDANWIARDLGLAITGLSGPLVLDRNRLTVDNVTARVNGGAVSISGALSTARNGAPSEVVFKGSGIALDVPAGVVSELSGEIRATSPGPRGLTYGLAGDVFVQPGIVRSSLRQLALSAIALTSPGTAASNLSDVMSEIGLDVRIRTLDNLVADSNELKLSVAGDVTVTGTLAVPGMKGALTATDEGELFFGGKLYTVRSGSIDFVNPNEIDPRLNIVADTRVAGYDVTMQLLGPPTDITTRLTSDPPLSEGDLASLLATGRTLDERAGVTEEQAKTQLLSAVSSEYLGVVGRWFGLDTVRIEQNVDLSATDIDPVARLNVAKSFGQRLDVLYSQSLSESGDTAWVLTYHTGWRRLDVRATIETLQNEVLEVRQELTFGGGAKPRPQRRRTDTRPRVADITFSGLDANDERDARKQMKLDVGDRFDVYTWRRDQERIGAMFRQRDRQRVTVASYRRDVGRPDQVAIDYVVDAGPVTTLTVTGATLSDRAMDDMRAAWSRVGIDDFLVDEWREVATEDLIVQGYVQPRITTEITTPGNPWIRRDARIVIDPGQRVAAREIEFTGNALIPDEPLRQVVEHARIDPRVWVRPSLLVAPIRARYASLGHLEVTVRTGDVRVEGDRAVLPVTISEGRQYLVGALLITGEHAVTEDAISAALGLEVGAVYLPVFAQRGADRVAELYRREAFPDALVSFNATITPATATADVHVTINEGARHVLAEMTVSGDTITSPSLFRHVAALPLDKPLANRAVEDAQKRLYNTGIFSSVTPEIESIGAPDANGVQPVRVVFAVEEVPRYRLRYGLQATTNVLSENGFTSRDVQPGASLDLRRSNLFGRGIFAGVGASGTASSNRLRFLVGSATWFGYKADTIFSIERRYSRSSDPVIDIEGESLIARGEQRWPLTQHTRIAAGYEFQSEKISLTFIDPLSGFPLSGSVTSEIASVSGTYSWDTRDNVFNPLHGLFHSSRVELGDRAIGSDLRYFKVLIQQYGFLQRRGLVLASAVRFGVVTIGDENDVVSPAVRFRAGGATTVRGYAQDALTPQLFPDLPAGGDALLILNQEVRVPVWRWLGGIGFVDAGNTFPGASAISLSDLAVGVGGGVRLNTPFGIIRLDLGYPLSGPSALRRHHWYFGYGHAF